MIGLDLVSAIRVLALFSIFAIVFTWFSCGCCGLIGHDHSGGISSDKSCSHHLAGGNFETPVRF